MTDCRRAFVGTGVDVYLIDGQAEDEVVNGLHHLSDCTRDSSKRLKRSFSSLPQSRIFGSGMSDMPWGLPEKVEDNVHADVQPDTHQDAQHPAHDVVMTTGKRARDPEAEEVGDTTGAQNAAKVTLGCKLIARMAAF